MQFFGIVIIRLKREAFYEYIESLLYNNKTQKHGA